MYPFLTIYQPKPFKRILCFLFLI
eukprot:UN19290